MADYSIRLTVKDGSETIVRKEGTISIETDLANLKQHEIETLENCLGLDNYLTSETDPSVSDWAKQPQKPIYTPEDVGAQPKGNYVKSVNGSTPDESGNVSIEVSSGGAGITPVGDEKTISVATDGVISLKGFAEESAGIPCIQKQKVSGQTVKSLTWIDPPQVLVTDEYDENVKVELKDLSTETSAETVAIKVSEYYIGKLDGDDVNYHLIRSTPDGLEYSEGNLSEIFGGAAATKSNIVVSDETPEVTDETIWLQPLTTDTGAIDYITSQATEQERQSGTYFEHWNSGVVKYHKKETCTFGEGEVVTNTMLIPKTACSEILTHNIQVQHSGDTVINVWISNYEYLDTDIICTYKVAKPAGEVELTLHHSILGFYSREEV